MPDEVYRPPESTLTREAAPVATGRIDPSRAISEGWRAMVDAFPLWLGIGLLSPLLMIAATVTVIGFFLLVPVLVWGAIAALIAMFDGRGEFRLLFSGFTDYGTKLITMWGVLLLSIAVQLPGQAAALAGQATGEAGLAALGSLLNLAWSLAVVLPLSFAIYFAVDQGMGAVESFRTAWRATRGQWLAIFLLVLAGVAIALLGLLALVVGIIPAMAVIAFMWISAYRQLAGSPPAR
jgi:uncharacterized membrane protein